MQSLTFVRWYRILILLQYCVDCGVVVIRYIFDRDGQLSPGALTLLKVGDFFAETIPS